MPKKRVVRDPQDEVDAQCKLLCDEAGNHMKVRNYTRALSVYQKVNVFLSPQFIELVHGWGVRVDCCA